MSKQPLVLTLAATLLVATSHAFAQTGRSTYYRGPNGTPAGSAYTPPGSHSTYHRGPNGTSAGSAYTPPGGHSTYYRDANGMSAASSYTPSRGHSPSRPGRR
jgi:hypothetical protein